MIVKWKIKSYVVEIIDLNTFVCQTDQVTLITLKRIVEHLTIRTREELRTISPFYKIVSIIFNKTYTLHITLVFKRESTVCKLFVYNFYSHVCLYQFIQLPSILWYLFVSFCTCLTIPKQGLYTLIKFSFILESGKIYIL